LVVYSKKGAKMFTAQERREYIGGSDIAAIMNMNRWKTPLKLWLEKTGEIEPDDLSQNDSVQLGIELEEFVAQKFSKETKKPVRKQNKMYRHKDFPFLVAHVDRLITNSDEILECKTCSFYKKEEWEDEKIPTEYIMQVIWYLGITGKKKGYIAVLIGGQTFKYKPVQFDKELFDLMVEAACEFWNFVQTKTMPRIFVNDNSILSKAFHVENQDFIEIQNIEKTVKKLQRIKKRILNLKKRQEFYEVVIKKAININSGLLTKKYKVTWKNENTTRVDTEKLKKDKLYEQYSYTTESRKLRVTKNKLAA